MTLFGDELVCYYDTNSSRLDFNYDLNVKNNLQERLNALIDAIYLSKKKGITDFRIDIDGFIAPTGEETFYSSLCENRVNRVFDYMNRRYQSMLRKDSVGVTTDLNANFTINMSPHGQDWNGFMEKLANSDLKDRNSMINVVNSYSSLTQKEQEIRNLIVINPGLDTIIRSLERVQLRYSVPISSLFQLSLNIENTNEVDNAVYLEEKGYSNNDSQGILLLADHTQETTTRENLFKRIEPSVRYDRSFYNEYGILLVNMGSYREGLEKFQKSDSLIQENLKSDSLPETIKNLTKERVRILNNEAIANYYLGMPDTSRTLLNKALSYDSDEEMKRKISQNVLLLDNWSQISEPVAITSNSFTLKPTDVENEKISSFINSKKCAVIIGISDYQLLNPASENPVPGNFYDLKYAANDADQFYTLMTNPDYFGENWETTRLINSQATSDSIYNTISRIFGESEKDDIIYIYFSGHGNIDKNGNTFLLAYNSNPNAPTPGNAIDYSNWLKNQILTCRSEHVTLFIDACYSGTLYLLKGGQDYLQNQLLKEETTKIVFTSGTSKESSAETNELKSGIFTHFLILGLQSEAPDYDHDPFVDSNELMDYLTEQVKNYQKTNSESVIFIPSYDRTFKTTEKVPICLRKQIP
jgi:tetratricopeptide (TPR) repeat protein